MKPSIDRAQHLRLIHNAPPQRIEVRLTAIAGLYPYGGVTRSYQLTRAGLDALIETAKLLEASG